ncbi:hypothetical protein ABZ671_04280 [Micromonospora sp. NPDC006766]|uniref:hypothetical protein n=1 Tax=Micromonospora sp. NPDC006766 TaxID=3154778 RepID=UPI003410472B
MKKARIYALVGAAAMVGGALVATPASAVTCDSGTACSTTVTFTLTPGTFQITVPDSPVALANNGTPGGYAYGQLGSVTVSDNRESATPSWTVTVTGTTFTNPAGGPTIPTSSVYYCSGTATATTGSGTFTPGQTGCAAPPPPTGQTVDTGPIAYSHGTDGTGNNSATWNPLITVSIPADAVAGTFTGTITHTLT